MRFCIATQRAILAIAFGITGSCAATMAAAPAPAAHGPQQRAGDVQSMTVLIPGDQQWVATGVSAQAGEPLTLSAKGRIGCFARSDRHAVQSVGPEGTYFAGDGVAGDRFPLPAADAGPAPCYCLIGRIGDGPPFYVGRRRSWIPSRSGPLYLGINDDHPDGNAGAFQVEVTRPALVEPIGFRTVIVADVHPTGGATPLPCKSVVVFYVDGLRPDVVEEMAAMGHLPNLRRYFLEGGTRMAQSVTVFPSNTITSNGTLWTGRFSDRHGLKSQTRFSRRTLKAVPHLDALGPSETAGVLGRRGLDRLDFQLRGVVKRLFQGEDEARRWSRSQTTATPALYDYLHRAGKDWAPSILPINPDLPPVLWSRHLVNELPLFGAHEAIFHLDPANARYAVGQQLRNEQAVTVVWLPDVDTHSHHASRGQFGCSRRVLARCDALIGQVIDKLCRAGRLDDTYLMVVSDHGHTGGRRRHLQRYDLAHEFFYAPRQVDRHGHWLGGGLGMSVRQHREHHRHEGDGSKQFVFLDADANGAARIFLPTACYAGGCWSRPNRFAELVNYQIDDHLPPVNLIERLTLANAGTAQRPRYPVDLVLAGLDERSVLVASGTRGWAVIQRHRTEAGHYVYRYQVIRDYGVTRDGRPAWRPDPSPKSDPLRLLDTVPAQFLSEFHDEGTWLEVTLQTPYPDSVVSMARHMLWDERLRDRRREYAPDLVATAAPGWQFGAINEPGTSHGHPLRDTMLNTWLIAGPGVRRGAIVQKPCRSVDVLPTILEMADVPFDPGEFDGRALRSIYEPNNVATAAQTMDPPGVAYVGMQQNTAAMGTLAEAGQVATYWSDVDLQAWAPLDYRPRPEFEHGWSAVHRYDHPWDLHNVFFNLSAISDWELVRLIDDLSAAAGSRAALRERLDEAAADLDLLGRQGPTGRRYAEGIDALQVPHLALGDTGYTSSGNWHRANLLIDWTQNRYAELDHTLARPVGLPSVLGSPLLNGGVDHVQGAASAVRIKLQRIILRAVLQGVIDPVENAAGAIRNAGKATPAEVVVD